MLHLISFLLNILSLKSLTYTPSISVKRASCPSCGKWLLLAHKSVLYSALNNNDSHQALHSFRHIDSMKSLTKNIHNNYNDNIISFISCNNNYLEVPIQLLLLSHIIYYKRKATKKCFLNKCKPLKKLLKTIKGLLALYNL